MMGEPESIVAPDRMAGFTWQAGDLDFAPRNPVLRLLWRRTWTLRSAWRRLISR
jgi:hypothetical protein